MMDWSWERIPAEYLVTGVKLVRDGKLAARKGFLHVKKGRVEAIGVGAPAVEGLPALDADGLVLAPGFVDLHVHFREPGQEEKETVATGSRAAAAGGFTAVVTMPNTDPAVDNAGLVRYVIDRGREAGLCRVLPTGAISVGRLGESMAEMGAMVEAGAVGFTDDGSPTRAEVAEGLRDAINAADEGVRAITVSSLEMAEKFAEAGWQVRAAARHRAVLEARDWQHVELIAADALDPSVEALHVFGFKDVLDWVTFNGAVPDSQVYSVTLDWCDSLPMDVKEGIEFVYNTLQTEVVTRGNGIALKCVETTAGEPDADGRLVPNADEAQIHE